MNINKITVIGSVFIIAILIIIPTSVKVIKNHNEHLYEAVYDKIIDSAKKCYYDDVCTEEKITLASLYEKEYLEKVSNPVTKEYYNAESYVLRDNNNFKFVVVE